MVGTLTLLLNLPGCKSLKEKRSRLKPFLARLHREFNISVAEMDLHNRWTQSKVSCAMVGMETATLQRHLAGVLKWIEANWPDGQILDFSIEMIS